MSRPEKPIASVAAIACAVLCLVVQTTSAADAFGTQDLFQPCVFEAAVQDVKTTGWQQLQRVSVSCGTNKFDFVAPLGLRLSAKPDRLTLVASNSTYSLTFRILSSGTTGLNPGRGVPPREFLLSQFPGASVIEEFFRTAANRNGPAFELRQKVAGGAVQASCVAFIPSAAGFLEFSFTAPLSKSAEAKVAFNSLLRTFRSNQFGKLEITTTDPGNS